MKIELNKMPFIYFSDKAKAEYMQRRIVVYSIVYYELNQNIISDHDFDMLCNQYIKFVTRMTLDDLKSTRYYYLFKDFDGSTGFHLCHNMTLDDQRYLYMIADNVLMQFNKEKGGRNGNSKRINK